MKVKIKDLFFAGITFGIVNGLIYHLYVYILNLFHVLPLNPWGVVTTLFFDPPEVNKLSAQIFGFLMSIAAPITISILLCLLVKLTGRDFIYVKSIALAEGITFFTFAIFPLFGINCLKHSITSNYVAFFGGVLFGLILGYFVKKYTDFGEHW